MQADVEATSLETSFSEDRCYTPEQSLQVLQHRNNMDSTAELTPYALWTTVYKTIKLGTQYKYQNLSKEGFEMQSYDAHFLNIQKYIYM